MKERLVVRKVVVAVVVTLLVVAVGVGGYLQLYRPSQTAVLTASAPPMRPQMQATFSVTPFDQLPEADRDRFTAALLDAAHTIEPGYEIVEQQMFVKYHGYEWARVRKLSGEYLGNRFGYREQADAKARVGGDTVNYLIWRGGWLRRQFDDRLVLAVALDSMLQHDTATMVFGYFVMQPR